MTSFLKRKKEFEKKFVNAGIDTMTYLKLLSFIETLYKEAYEEGRSEQFKIDLELHKTSLEELKK